MPKDLFDDGRYEPFGDVYPDDYPFFQFKPPHPVFDRRGEVIAGTRHRRKFFVDMGIGECQCSDNPGGYAFAVNDRAAKGGWYERAYCVHKLRMMSLIVQRFRDGAEETKFSLKDIESAYLKSLGSRYNQFEVVSAFHKELRRGDFSAAWFWGLILTTKRGIRGVLNYMLNIIYEETRDHDLADYLLRARTSPALITFTTLSRCISWFCATPKKWELPLRLAIFTAEMKGYDALVKDYGKDVAKGGNIIAQPGAKESLLKHMQHGAKKNDFVQFQRGLKGLQKLKYFDGEDRDGSKLQEHRLWLYSELYDLGESLHPDSHGMWRIVEFVNRRIAAGLGIGYHELNAIADALAGEPIDAGILAGLPHKLATARPQPQIPLFHWPQIPLYAQDNHTFAGKRLINRFPDQLKPGAAQTDLDFRWCGAYFGVAYRMLCHNQHGKVDGVEWREVEWPSPYYRIVNSLWY
mgnify:CR=1 FL=1